MSPEVADMSLCEDALLAAASFVVLCGHQRRRQRRVWARPSLLYNRNGEAHQTLINMLIEDDACLPTRTIKQKGVFENFLRISQSDFMYLLQTTGSNISKHDTKYRQSIPAQDRLAVTLRYLATGDSYTSLGNTFKISKQAISLIVPDVCEALITALSDYIKVGERYVSNYDSYLLQ